MLELQIKLSDTSGMPYYRQIVDQIRDMIRSGLLSPDTQLPSFRELAAQTLVSLITVRRAYSDLEAAGLIVRKQGQGTFVASDVDIASREKSINDAKRIIDSAIRQAKMLGFDNGALLKYITEKIGSGNDQQ